MKKANILFALICLFQVGCKEKSSKEGELSGFSESQAVEILELIENQEVAKFGTLEISEEIARDLDSSVNIEMISDKSLIPSAFRGRVYTKEPLDGYREDLTDLVGLIATKRNDQYSVGVVSFAINAPEFKAIIPKNGTLVERTIEKKNEKKLGWILSIELEDNEMMKYTIQDQARAILTDKNIDFNKIKAVFNESNWENRFLIVLATSTEITHRRHTKRGRRVRFDEIPVLGSAFSANSSVYISNEALQRDYKVGLRLVSIQDILEQHKD